MPLISAPPTNEVDRLEIGADRVPVLTGIRDGWRNFFNSVFNICNALTMSGTTAQRPTVGLWAGRTYWDVTLSKPTWYSGLAWVFTGTVTSVAQTFTGGLISVAGSPITTSGTLALTVAGTSGGIPYFSGATTWASSAALTANAIVLGGGAGNPPATTATGTGVVTALGVNVGTAGAFVTFNGAGGTPSSMTATNLSGTAASLTSGLATDTVSKTGTGSTYVTNAVPSFATTIGVGGATAVASGAGVSFPATQSASTDANTLDDYEEGTWTPDQGSGLTVVGVFSSSGRYTKIGRQVLAEGDVAGSVTVAAAAGGDLCSNLPFTAATLAIGGATNNSVNVFSGTVCSGTRLIDITAIGATPRIYFSIAYTV